MLVGRAIDQRDGAIGDCEPHFALGAEVPQLPHVCRNGVPAALNEGVEFVRWGDCHAFRADDECARASIAHRVSCDVGFLHG